MRMWLMLEMRLWKDLTKSPVLFSANLEAYRREQMAHD
jgi:hypothetical protein